MEALTSMVTQASDFLWNVILIDVYKRQVLRLSPKENLLPVGVLSGCEADGAAPRDSILVFLSLIHI